jgi:hypothetical protein
MAKDLGSQQFMEDFDSLSKSEQEKFIATLQKKQKKEPVKPTTSSREGRKDKATDGVWD